MWFTLLLMILGRALGVSETQTILFCLVELTCSEIVQDIVSRPWLPDVDHLFYNRLALISSGPPLASSGPPLASSSPPLASSGPFLNSTETTPILVTGGVSNSLPIEDLQGK